MLAEQKAGGYSTKYRFTGKEVDEETGLYYFGARYYDPRISLWYGVDPLAEKYPSWNPFNYTMNNPIRFIDPTGKETEESNGGGDPKKKDQNPSNQPPIPQKPVSPQYQDPNAPPAGRGIELTKNLPKQESDSLDPPISNDHPIGQESMIDISDLIPTKGATTGGVKLSIGLFFTKGGKEILEEGTENAFKKMAKPGLLKPGNNQVQNSQFKKLAKEFNLTRKQSEEMHREIRKEGLDLDYNGLKNYMKERFQK